jgi:hypothetical protein
MLAEAGRDLIVQAGRIYEMSKALAESTEDAA